MKTKEEILQEKYYKYFESSFSTEERGREFADICLSVKEEIDSIYEAMEAYATEAWNEAIEAAAELSGGYTKHYEWITNDIKESILKLKKL